jgi:hypothetical protein
MHILLFNFTERKLADCVRSSHSLIPFAMFLFNGAVLYSEEQTL